MNPISLELRLHLVKLQKKARSPTLRQPNNAYMDDLCDFVDSVMEAKQQTEGIDTVLEKGGFKVKVGSPTSP